MDKKFLIAWSVMFVAWMVGSFLVHGLIMGSEYTALPDLFRSEADSQRYFPLMILAHVFIAGAFTWIYVRGKEDKPWLSQGLRFGFVIVLFSVVPTYTIYFAVQPMPGSMVVKQILFDGMLVILLGTTVAFLYRNNVPA